MTAAPRQAGATAAPDPADAPGTAASPDARTLWRRARGPLAALAVLLLTAAVLALATARDSGSLDPTAASPAGSRAVAELLDREGVTTTVATTLAEARDGAGADRTVLVTEPDAVAPSHLARLQETVTAAGGRLVLVAPTEPSLDAVAPGTTTADDAPADETAPDCSAPAPQRAGAATVAGHRYALPERDSATVTSCYETDGLPSLAVLDHEPGETVLLGSPHILLNQHLAEHGNAALALGLLGGHPELTWYLPDPGEAPPPEDAQGPLDLLPDGWRWAALQLGIAAALAALWRGRRLGPLVTERLPVRIHAAETTEGRARLYHRAGARDRAADALRAAARDRLASCTGVPTASHDGEALITAVAARAGQHPAEVRDLLHGAAPPDDRALVRLADQLDALERRVGPTGPAGQATDHGPDAGTRPGTGGAPAPTDDPPTEDTPS